MSASGQSQASIAAPELLRTGGAAARPAIDGTAAGAHGLARLGNGPSVIGFTLSAALVIVTFLLAATTSADADLWGHVRFGLDMLREGRIVLPDSYSFTSDRPWINHEWLAEVVFAAAWSTAGQPGLLFVKLAVIGSVLWLVGSALTRRGVSGRALVILLALILAATLTRVVHVRPQLFSVLFFAALASALTRADGGARRTLAWCPVILMLWANSHGGWIVGMATLGLWTVLDLWRRRRLGLTALDAAGWATLSVLATLVNPYGSALWHFLLETVRPGREAIGEWNWIWSHPPSVLTWLLFAAMTTIALRRQARWLDALVPAFWGLAAIKVVRLDAFFALSVVMFLGPAIAEGLRRERRAPRPPLSRTVRAAIVAALLALALAQPRSRDTLSCVQLFERWWPEPEAASVFHEHRLSGNVITFFNWGEYAIWHLPADTKVSLDGRRETVYSDGVVSSHLAFYAARPQGIAYVRGLNADYAWLPRDLPGTTALRQHGWTSVFEGERSVILAPPGRWSREPLTAASTAAGGPQRCFPGP